MKEKMAERKLMRNEWDGTPSLRIFHPNAKCTGSMIRVALEPSTSTNEGFVRFDVAAQCGVASRENGCYTRPAFDYEHCISFDLDIESVCKIVQVFRGEYESVNYGKGIYIHRGDVKMIVNMDHLIDPVQGYRLCVCESNGSEERTMQIFLNPSEALGLSLALENSMGHLAFGK